VSESQVSEDRGERSTNLRAVVFRCRYFVIDLMTLKLEMLPKYSEVVPLHQEMKLPEVEKYEKSSQGQRSKSNVTNFQLLLAFTMTHMPVRSHQLLASFFIFYRLTDRQTDRHDQKQYLLLITLKGKVVILTENTKKLTSGCSNVVMAASKWRSYSPRDRQTD